MSQEKEKKDSQFGFGTFLRTQNTRLGCVVSDRKSLLSFSASDYSFQHCHLLVIMGIVDDIKNNAITTLHLSEAPEDYFTDTDAFVDAMAGNTSIEEVIFGKDFLSCSVGMQRAAMVSSIGTLPAAKSVTLSDSLLNVGVCVTNLVKNSKSLEELFIENCLLQGSTEHFKLLEDAINNSPTLKTLRIKSCNAPNEKVTLANVVESLREGLQIDVSGEGDARIQ
jgi:hypothetical protein